MQKHRGQAGNRSYCLRPESREACLDTWKTMMYDNAGIANSSKDQKHEQKERNERQKAGMQEEESQLSSRRICERILTSNNGTGESVSTIETDTVSTSRSVNLNLSSIWLEVLGRIFGCDTALNSETTSGDLVLGETKLC